MNTPPEKKQYEYITDSYHQFFLQEYNGCAKEIYCKKDRHVLARISSEGHLEVFKGHAYNVSPLLLNLLVCKDTLLVRDILLQMYNRRKGRNFYTRGDIGVIFCNMMKVGKMNLFSRKGCYFLGECYSCWEKFKRGY